MKTMVNSIVAYLILIMWLHFNTADSATIPTNDTGINCTNSSGTYCGTGSSRNMNGLRGLAGLLLILAGFAAGGLLGGFPPLRLPAVPVPTYTPLGIAICLTYHIVAIILNGLGLPLLLGAAGIVVNAVDFAAGALAAAGMIVLYIPIYSFRDHPCPKLDNLGKLGARAFIIGLIIYVIIIYGAWILLCIYAGAGKNAANIALTNLFFICFVTTTPGNLSIIAILILCLFVGTLSSSVVLLLLLFVVLFLFLSLMRVGFTACPSGTTRVGD